MVAVSFEQMIAAKYELKGTKMSGQSGVLHATQMMRKMEINTSAVHVWRSPSMYSIKV
jgi:hypothetical protein